MPGVSHEAAIDRLLTAEPCLQRPCGGTAQTLARLLRSRGSDIEKVPIVSRRSPDLCGVEDRGDQMIFHWVEVVDSCPCSNEKLSDVAWWAVEMYGHGLSCRVRIYSPGLLLLEDYDDSDLDWFQCSAGSNMKEVAVGRVRFSQGRGLMGPMKVATRFLFKPEDAYIVGIGG